MKPCNGTLLRQNANEIRKKTLRMALQSNSGHLGGAFSCIDLLTVLYFNVLRVTPKKPSDSQRDRFILSKGHASNALYATLCRRGFLSQKMLDTYLKDGSLLGAHPVSMDAPGVDFLSGSLGHGLSAGAGMALAAKRDRKNFKVYVLISDGESNEGATWEAALFASHHKLDNLIVIVDYNRLQAFGENKDVLNLNPFRKKWEAFGFAAREINGHIHKNIYTALHDIPYQKNKPSVVIAHTVKGRGVSFMEDRIEWHYLTPDEGQGRRAMDELEKKR